VGLVTPSGLPLPVPDLLCAEPKERIDVPALRQTLVFAFAAGASTEAFDDAMASIALPATTWDRADFARHVYLDELVAHGLPIRLSGREHAPCARHLLRALGEPPAALGDVEVRRAVLSELAAGGMQRDALERAAVAIVGLRSLLCAPRQPSPRIRRIEILRAAREVFDLLAGSFAEATSALSRLRSFGEAVVSGAGYRRLADLLDHEDNHAMLDLRVRVGSDGEVRALQIAGVHENRGNPFYLPVLRRWVARLALAFRGIRVTRGEIAERLLSEVFAGVEYAVALLFQLLADIEVFLASLGLRDRAVRAGLGMSLPLLGAPGTGLRLEGLFNPLLLAAGITPAPCDLQAAPAAVVLVTGPNSGGKTRLLQAVAIAQLLSQAGLFAPVRSGQVPRATGLFASLFEEARPDQPEGHLGMELLRIRRLFDRLEEGGVVVLDELCSGTNPSEGEEIARMVLALLPELGVQAFVTTHLLQFAERLARERTTASLNFLQVELDGQDRPTYRFVPGVAKTSLAQKTAARLGVTREELMARIVARRVARGRAATPPPRP
jgi:DNA mismatch repair protein MutS2